MGEKNIKENLDLKHPIHKNKVESRWSTLGRTFHKKVEIQFFNIQIHTVMRKPINLFESKYWKIHIPLVTTFIRIGGVKGEREAIAL